MGKTMCLTGFHYNLLVVTHALCVNLTSCANVHELFKGYCSDKWEGTRSLRLYIYKYML